MSVFMPDFIWDDCFYITIVWNSESIRRRTDWTADTENIFSGAAPSGSSGGRFILGGRNAGRV